MESFFFCYFIIKFITNLFLVDLQTLGTEKSNPS